MADADFDDFDGYGAYDRAESKSARSSGSFQKFINGAGAVTSVALIVGLAVWAYNLAVRDVRGIPVIEALEGPARVAPDNPGGELALHQGMAVNEIAADGTAGEAPDTLTLAPKPEGLSEEDQPMEEFAGAAEEAPVSGAVEPGVENTAPALAESSLTEPLPDGPADPINPVAPFVAPDVIAAEIPGIARSPRPVLRPVSMVISDVEGNDGSGTDAMAEAAAAAVAAALAAPATIDVSASALAEGTRLVQIGAYPDEAEARLEWDKTAARFGALMDGKRRVIEPAESGGKTFYRLRVEGFADLDDARRFCAALKADNAECVPAMVR